MLLLCTSWVERLGGREEVEKMANFYWPWYSAVAPYANIDTNQQGRPKMK